MTAQRKSYSRQFKIDAVRPVTAQGHKITTAARNLEISPNLLGKWKSRSAKERDRAFPGKDQMTPEQEELFRLRKENQRLRSLHSYLEYKNPNAFEKNFMSANAA